MQDNVIHLNIVGDSCESTLLLKREADILSTSYDISIHSVTHQKSQNVSTIIMH